MSDQQPSRHQPTTSPATGSARPGSSSTCSRAGASHRSTARPRRRTARTQPRATATASPGSPLGAVREPERWAGDGIALGGLVTGILATLGLVAVEAYFVWLGWALWPYLG